MTAIILYLLFVIKFLSHDDNAGTSKMVMEIYNGELWLDYFSLFHHKLADRSPVKQL